MSKRFILSIIMLFICNILLFAQTNENQKKDATITIGDTVLSLEQAIDIVIKQNLILQSAKYDVVMSDTAYEKAQKKYSTNLNMEGGYLNQEVPPSGSTVYTGTKYWQWDAALSLSKQFTTGTLISAGVRETFFDSNDPSTRVAVSADPATGEFNYYTASPEPAYHKPALFASIQQELLKNAFGLSDRKINKMLENSTEMQRAALINMLAGLVVNTLVDYWNITVQKASMETAQAALDSNKHVLGIIARNARYGLTEQYEVNQYNAIVASAEANLEAAGQRYREAVRTLLRTINMPPETSVTGVTDLKDELPVLNTEAALKSGFEKRVDYRNSLLALENTKLDLDVQNNNMLPSVTVSLGLTTQGLGTSGETAEAYNEAVKGDYPAWQVRARVTYPLDDRDAKAGVRNAYLKHKQAEINLTNIKLEIRDDILNRLDQVKTQHQMLLKARTADNEAELYYKNVLRRFEQGKVTAVTMKLSTDYMVQSRQQALNSLVQYNVALLLFDLSKNEIFDRYHVDVEKYLKNIKE